MAKQPKKNTTNSFSRKVKTTRKKSTNDTKKSPSKIVFQKNILIILFVLSSILLVSFGYFLGQKGMISDVRENEIIKELSQIKVKKPLEEKKVTVDDSFKVKSYRLDEPVKNMENKKLHNVQIISKKVKNTVLAYRGEKPKLVIIIDDVHSEVQLDAIKNLDMKITPSIFPPYALSKQSHLLANELEHYMIHLPMESGSKQFNKQYKTLMTFFSNEQIIARVKELRELFPHGVFVNNHTGSTFTQNYRVMKKLYDAMRREGFIFIDSYTIASSKIRKIAHEYGDAYVSRDIFIDNKHTITSIHEQLKKAVSIAKEKGYALAIGHPHKVTMQALESAQDILNDVELVYIDEIYR